MDITKDPQFKKVTFSPTMEPEIRRPCVEGNCYNFTKHKCVICKDYTCHVHMTKQHICYMCAY